MSILPLDSTYRQIEFVLNFVSSGLSELTSEVTLKGFAISKKAGGLQKAWQRADGVSLIYQN